MSIAVIDIESIGFSQSTAYGCALTLYTRLFGGFRVNKCFTENYWKVSMLFTVPALIKEGSKKIL